MIANRWAAALACLLVLGLVASCERTAKETGPPKLKILGAGSTFAAALYKHWIEVYQKSHKDVAITYDAVGSGAGTKRFLNQEVDFGASDAALSDEQMEKVARGAKLIPATAGTIVLLYNLKGLAGPLKLPRQVYVGIFSGKIKKWNDPRIAQANPGLNLPASDIILVTRLDSSGTTFAFTNHLSAISPTWRDRGPGVGTLVQWPKNTMTARGNEGVAGRIKLTDGAIGYVEYGYALRAGLPMAWLENKAGNFIQPSPSSGLDTLLNTQADMPANLRMFFPDPPGKSSYPLVTYSWILLYGAYPDTKKGAVVKDFVQWGVTDGQRFAEALGYCPLPDSIRERATKAIGEIK